MNEPPTFQLGFADYAAVHPEVGEPTTAEYQISPVYTVQETTTGLLVYQIATNQIAFADFAPDEESSMPEIRDRIMAEAAAREGMPYQLEPPPDGVTTTDCSLYVLQVYEAAGLPFEGVRTAEQIRQASIPINWDDVRPGDLLFFEHTYEPSEPPGPDGHVASHIGISYGAGTFRMWNAVEPAVTTSDISSAYWQDKIFSAGAAPALFAADAIPTPGETTEVIDVSNYQPWAQDPIQLEAYCAALSPSPTRVIVRLASYLEPLSLREIAVNELRAADACGFETEGYVWVYAGANAEREAAYTNAQVLEAAPKSLYAVWLDLEDEDAPPLGEIKTLAQALAGYGYVPGVYSGKYYIDDHYPNCPSEMAELPLWVANYSDAYTIDTVPVPAPWTQAEGWQRTDTPIDRSTFRA